MAFITDINRDKRAQFVRYNEDGSEHFDSSNPNKNTTGVADRGPLITKPFEFDYNQLNSRTTDLERFIKFLGTPGGLKMQGNIAILQQSGRDLRATFNKNKKVGGSTVGNILRAAKEVVLDTIKGNVGFTTTLAKQIPVNGTGTHFVNNLNGPAYLRQGGDPKSALGNFLKNTLNLPDTLFGFKLNSNPEGVGTVVSNFVEGTDRKMISVYDTEPNVSDSLIQDPGRKAKEILDGFAKKANQGLLAKSNEALGLPKPETKQLIDNSGPLSKAYAASRRTRLEPEEDTGFPGTKDLKKNTAVYKVNDEEYTISKAALENKLGFKDESGKYFDDLGNRGPQKSDNIDITLEDEEELKALFNKQIIPFSFSSLTPEKSKSLFFRAFLDDFSDNYTSNWNPQQYIGRGEQFFTYQNFVRNISFSFKVAAFNFDSLTKIYDNLNILAGTTAPNYAPEGNFMRGTLTRISIGEYLYRQTGFISSIGLSWNKSYPWEIDAYSEGLDRLPHILDVQVQFTPIHDFNVKSDLDLEGEKYFGYRSKREPATALNVNKSGIKKTDIKPKGEDLPLKRDPIKTPPKPPIVVPPIPLTPPTPLVDLDFEIPNAVSDTVQFTTTGEGLDTIGTEAERINGQKGVYLED